MKKTAEQKKEQVNKTIDKMVETMQENKIDLGKLSVDELVYYCLEEK